MNVDRRGALRILIAGGLAAGATTFFGKHAETGTGPTTIEQVYADAAKALEKKWPNPLVDTDHLPAIAPYLPATEAEGNDFGNSTGKWQNVTFNRILSMPSNHPLDHIQDEPDILRGYGERRAWGDIVAWEGTWFYPMMRTGSLVDIANDIAPKVRSGGKMVDIDPIRADSWSVAVNVVKRSPSGDSNNPDAMALYMVPWVAGEIHARMPQDQTRGEVAIAFALNGNYEKDKTGGDPNKVPAVILRGVAGAPVNLVYGYPTDDQGNYNLITYQTRTEMLTGNVTVHLPREGAKGNFKPFVVIDTQVMANNPKGETEIFFDIGSDVRVTDPKWAPKHRITEEMILSSVQA